MNVKLLIVSIFNNILNVEHYPSCWAEGTIIPVFKTGDNDNTDNYRGITLISCLGKLFTRVLNNRLGIWAEQEGILGETQFGFRKGREVSDCLFILHGLIELLLTRGSKLYCAFIDYEKCYDYLDRTAVWVKLMRSGVSSKIISIFRSMYSRITLKVDGSTDCFYPYCGLLQGESTSPLLFSMFVCDLENSFPSELSGIQLKNIIMKLLMFADDTVIVSETKEGLQRGLDSLYMYCMKWGITVNTKKTKAMVFKKGGRIAKSDSWTYGGQVVETVNVFKYLGFHLSSSGSFSNGIQERVKSARRALFALKQYFSTNTEILLSTKMKMFNSVVLPVLSYGSEVWGISKAAPIERFHIQFLKSILHVKSSTPNCYVYGELGVYPLDIDRKVRIIKYVHFMMFT